MPGVKLGKKYDSYYYSWGIIGGKYDSNRLDTNRDVSTR